MPIKIAFLSRRTPDALILLFVATPAERPVMTPAGSSIIDIEASAHAFGRLASIYRRQRRYPDAAAAWTHLLKLPRVPGRLRCEVSLALAVHHEHRLRDLRQAQCFAEHALKAEPHHARRLAVQHRLTRLQRKIGSTTERMI